MHMYKAPNKMVPSEEGVRNGWEQYRIRQGIITLNIHIMYKSLMFSLHQNSQSQIWKKTKSSSWDGINPNNVCISRKQGALSMKRLHRIHLWIILLTMTITQGTLPVCFDLRGCCSTVTLMFLPVEGPRRKRQEIVFGLSGWNGSRLTDFTTWRNFQSHLKFALPLAHDSEPSEKWQIPNGKLCV